MNCKSRYIRKLNEGLSSKNGNRNSSFSIFHFPFSISSVGFFLAVFFLTRLLTSCARMGQPDGGWYDEKPPHVVTAEPAENGINVTKKKLKITFNEFIKVENASEKVLVSPAQHEQPEVKATGKNIVVELQDTLIPNTTYTVDFSDAISDNNEGNPMGNYTYTFSTGATIDTLEVSGYVLEAENLEPVKGILVGLYAPGDSVMRRIGRTDSYGKFVIRGIAPGKYTIGALMDQDNDYRFSQKSEEMAFSHDTIVPTCGPDTRQDTLWLDENHIKDIKVVGYTHFRPDDITLRAFTHKATDRYFLKAERKEANNFTLFYTAPTPDSQLPELRLLNAPATSSSGVSSSSSLFLAEPTAYADTVTFWLRDTAIVNQDTLQVEVRTLLTDTLGVLQSHTDTIEILAKTPYAKRLKDKNKMIEEWQKDLKKRLKHAEPGEVIDTIMPRETLKIKYDCPSTMSPNGSMTIEFPTPLERFDTAAVHLYVEQDSLWYRAPLVIQSERSDTDTTEVSGLSPSLVSSAYSATCRSITLYTDWIPGANYSFEVDSMAFTDIYGMTNGKYKTGIEVSSLDEFGSLFVNVSGISGSTGDSGITADSINTETPAAPTVYVQLLDGSGKVVMTSPAKDGTAEFYYIKPAIYYIRCFIDSNGNGIWDTGDYTRDLQPEEVFYAPESIECKAKWDLTRNWNVRATPLYKQKPAAIVQQKPEAEKTIKKRNLERAMKEGIDLPEYLQ